MAGIDVMAGLIGIDPAKLVFSPKRLRSSLAVAKSASLLPKARRADF
jgi:hypothetical protein